MGKFKKGAFLGGLLGAGLMWLGTTKKGREVREKMMDHAGEVYADVKAKVLDPKTMKQLNKNQYVKLVKSKVDKYAKKNKMAGSAKKSVEKLVASQWPKIKRELKKSSCCKNTK